LGRSIACCDCGVLHTAAVEKARKSMATDEKIADVSDLFRVLGDSTRIKILWALDNNELCVCDIASLIGMTKSAVSHQLKALRLSNLVKFRREGQIVYYSLADDHVKLIIEMGLEHINE
jgi:ArsR family transcriptional regulator